MCQEQSMTPKIKKKREERERLFLHLRSWQASKGDDLSNKNNCSKICYNDIMYKCYANIEKRLALPWGVMGWAESIKKPHFLYMYFSFYLSHRYNIYC